MKIQFKARRKMFRDTKTNYTICRGKVLKYEGESKYPVTSELTFKGTMINYKDKDTYTAIGEIKVDPARGFYFEIEKIELERLEYEEEIVRFIKKYSNRVPKDLIEPIVKAYGVNTIQVIGAKDGFEKIKALNIPKLGDKRIKSIREAVIYNKNYENVMMFLEFNNLPVDIASDIVDNLGKEAIMDLKMNPYQLIKYIDFSVLDVIGYKYIKNARNVDRIVAGIISYVKDDIVTNGNVYTEKSDLIANIDSYLQRKGAYADYKTDSIILEEAFDIIVEQGLLKMIKEDDTTYIYRKDMSFMEKRIAEKIVELSEFTYCRNTRTYILEKLKKFEEEKGLTLDECQVEAVLSTLQSNLSVLSGGPGTGKTFTTNLIKTIYRNLNEDAKILLLAPTGKASKRLAELCEEEAMTIHRGLGIRPLEEVNETDKLEADFIIVDEASMIDIQMLYNLLVKIKNGTKVLFVGDYQQLPSVGAGLVLRDLMNCGEVNVVRLTKIFRQALTSNIVHNSHKMIEGATKGYKFEKDTFMLEMNNVTKYETKILQIIKKVEENGYNIDDVVILSPTKKGYLGTRTINDIIQKTWNTNNNPEDIYKVSDVRMFKVGDKVMHTKNNYDLDVFNGEVGRVIGVVPNSSITVDYSDRVVVYNNKEDIRELELAYAMTIHKSQGSEYPIVVSIVSDMHKYMLNRNLVYTAWTRAKEKLYVLGNKEAVIASAEKNDIVNRKSRLVKLISDMTRDVIF